MLSWPDWSGPLFLELSEVCVVVLLLVCAPLKVQLCGAQL